MQHWINFYLIWKRFGATSAALGKWCVSSYKGANLFPADLNSHLTEWQLQFIPHREMRRAIHLANRQHSTAMCSRSSAGSDVVLQVECVIGRSRAGSFGPVKCQGLQVAYVSRVRNHYSFNTAKVVIPRSHCCCSCGYVPSCLPAFWKATGPQLRTRPGVTLTHTSTESFTRCSAHWEQGITVSFIIFNFA